MMMTFIEHLFLETNDSGLTSLQYKLSNGLRRKCCESWKERHQSIYLVGNTTMPQKKGSQLTIKSHESEFGQLDLPKANIETMENYILWTRNKTSTWLEQKSPVEKEKLM